MNPPFFPEKKYSERYVKLHQERNQKLPVRSQRQEFLNKYQSEQSATLAGYSARLDYLAPSQNDNQALHLVRYAADVVTKAFAHAQSDILGRMNVLSCYYQRKKDLPEDEFLGWCDEYFINHRVATDVLAIRRQLLQHVIEKILMGKSQPLSMVESDDTYNDKIRQSLLAGFFTKAAMFVSQGDQYKNVRDNHPFALDPDSGLVGINHQWVICHNMHYAGVQYLKYVTAVEPERLIEYSFFDDERLPKKYTGEFKNPAMKQALDDARLRAQQQSQA
ncbi:pre-mRNA-splicing factor ATP-dependent RNA helicase prp43 [Fusarium beomiforme]|uniref:Pre-mRNA-splicing factor ATP-dependent RNA helicase prp43 n=1 Tax=Fusarium beomiforme TaxID=44412 RepID=A0A9P5AJW9_9HYPO|nr:pre-mRNA-splicing factor ATP-dependent RNA helicase prp43 [Fusarium beomiforme]